jgi:uncharacterized alkaline shock family protein YloU
LIDSPDAGRRARDGVAAGYYNKMVRATSRRTIGRAVRKAALGSYGVAAVHEARWYERPLGWFGFKTPGVTISSREPLRVEVNMDLVQGVPPAAVASNVTKAVRYIVQRDVGRPIDELTLSVGGQPLQPAPVSGTTTRRAT